MRGELENVPKLDKLLLSTSFHCLKMLKLLEKVNFQLPWCTFSYQVSNIAPPQKKITVKYYKNRSYRFHLLSHHYPKIIPGSNNIQQNRDFPLFLVISIGKQTTFPEPGGCEKR